MLLLQHPNKWYRQQALRQFGDRKDAAVLPGLQSLFSQGDAQTALEAIWAIHLSGGWNDEMARQAMLHADPYVRMWAVRLSGDQGKASSVTGQNLVDLASREMHPEVIGQLAATAKRLPAAVALPIFKALAPKIDQDDPDNPLMLWWSIEAKVAGHQEDIAEIFQDQSFWKYPPVKAVILDRLMQRLMMTGEAADHKLAAALFNQAPAPEFGELLMNGLLKGMRGKDLRLLPEYLLTAVKPFQANHAEGALAMGLRSGDSEAIDKVVKLIQDPNQPLPEKLAYIRIMAEGNLPGTVDAMLSVVENRQSEAVLIKTALRSLGAYASAEIGDRILKDYPDHLRADPEIRDATLHTLSSRDSWAKNLLDHIQVQKDIHASDVSREIVNQIKWVGNGVLQESAKDLWPKLNTSSTSEKEKEIARITSIVKPKMGSAEQGKKFFQILCSNCHQLNGKGGVIGPDLTGYDRGNVPYLAMQIVDPNLDIREGFVTYGLQAKDGRFISGIIKERSSREVTIQPVVGENITFSMEQVDSLVAQPISIMPERLTSNLTDQQVQDLFAYLMGEEVL
jgi:putative heme-binding domain-containing protein